MRFLKQSESFLAGLFKGAPKLNKSTKSTIINWLPWIAFVGGVVQLINALNLVKAYQYSEAESRFSQFIGSPAASRPEWTFWVVLALIVLVAQGLLLILSFQKLQAKKKTGWDMLLLSSLIGMSYALISLMVDDYGWSGGTGFFLGLLLSLLGLWVLFSVRDSYTGRDLEPTDLNPIEKKKKA